MPESPNPYMDPNFDPNGYVPNNGQMGFADGVDPYMQQGDWNQGQPAMMQGQQPFADGMQSGGIFDEYVSPSSMMSAQDIYANQAAQMGDPMMPDAGYYGAGMGGGYGDPGMGMGYDPMAAFPGQDYMGFDAQSAPGGFPGQQMGAGYGDSYQMDAFGQMAPSPAMSGAMGAQGQPSAFDQSAQMKAQQFGAPDAFSPQEQQGNPAATASMAAAGAGVGAAAAAGAMGAGGANGAMQGAQSGNVTPSQQQQPQQQQQQQAPQQQAAAVRPQPQPQQQAQPQQPAPARPPQGQPRTGAPRRRPSMPINPELAKPGKAKVALILAILSVVFSLVAPVGFVLSLFALNAANKYKRNGGRSAMGDAAKIFSIAGLVFSSLMLALIIWFIGYYLGYGEWSILYTTPITYFNNSPIGQIFSLPVPSR